jgi:phosphotransferase system enzyme I (PtsI)
MEVRALRGTPVVPGVGAGPVVRPGPAPRLDDDGRPRGTVDTRMASFDSARTAVAGRLEQLSARAAGAAAEVLGTTATLARDRGLEAYVRRRIEDGSGVVAATVGAVHELSDLFRSAGGITAERVTDLLDLRDRIVAELTGQPEPGLPVPDRPSVLLARDLAPVDVAALDPTCVVALATELGGATSHTAIIARQLGIPCVVAVAGLARVPVGTEVLVDGRRGEVLLEPAGDLVDERRRSADARRAAAASWRGPGRTRDGVGVQVLANVQDGGSARLAAQAPVEGVGLFRTELCFLGGDTEPTVDEQAAAYTEVLTALAPRPVVVRTLDAGSDKPFPYVGYHSEPNPALGVRGLRTARVRPDVLERQLDAIARAAGAVDGPVRVMAPMVATVAEAAAFAELVRARGLVPGAMIEVPSAALQADGLLRHLDFVSIGTNDLSQYALAADRMAPGLADLTDPWQPALLQLVAVAARAGAQAGKPVGVCGEAAADPLLACVLVGLGVRSLSMAAVAAAAVGAQLGEVDLAACERAAQAALGSEDPDRARAAVGEALASAA